MPPILCQPLAGLHAAGLDQTLNPWTPLQKCRPACRPRLSVSPCCADILPAVHVRHVLRVRSTCRCRPPRLLRLSPDKRTACLFTQITRAREAWNALDSSPLAASSWCHNSGCYGGLLQNTRATSSGEEPPASGFGGYYWLPARLSSLTRSLASFLPVGQ